jgi:uncharacterized protein YjbI with pentapeptide repeats
MAASKNVRWDTCAEDDCIGVRLPSGGKCWTHADDQDLDVALKRLSQDGDLDLRGVRLTSELLQRLLAEVPKNAQGHTSLRNAQFRQATFLGEAKFDWVTFEAEAEFEKATFHGKASFAAATFQGKAEFTHATFKLWGHFYRTTFQGDAMFGGTTFEWDAGFERATFQGTAWFHHAIFQHSAIFNEATFQRAGQVGPLLAKRVMLEGAVFQERAQIDIAAAAVSAWRAQFPAGVQLRLRWASVVLDDANLAAPAILAGAPSPFEHLDEDNAARRWERLPPGPRTQRWRPRLLSLCRADVAGLRVADVDLRACRFNGAHNLDKLRIEGEPLFASTHSWWRARRKTLAEEQQWRASRSGRGPRGWYSRACQPPTCRAYYELPAVLTPVQIAALYRELRKGREDAKDEPGAADFYYGEMEMRRHAARRFSPEWWLVSLYWLVSGYALRAWRALATLALVLVIVAGLWVYGGGFAPTAAPALPTAGPTSTVPTATTAPRGPTTTRPAPTTTTTSAPTTTTVTADTSFGGAMVYGARTVIGLARDPQPRLTRWGDILQILLRILGPVLLGLAILSVRGRVKR